MEIIWIYHFVFQEYGGLISVDGAKASNMSIICVDENMQGKKEKEESKMSNER